MKFGRTFLYILKINWFIHWLAKYDIYGIDTTRFNLIGKKVAFLPSYYDKISYFRNALIRHQQGSNYCIGTCALFILNDKQKKECGGYDVVITFWRKIIYSYPKIKYELGCM